MECELGFLRGRALNLTLEQVALIIAKKCEKFPTTGYIELQRIVFQEEGLDIPCRIIAEYCHKYEPHLIKLHLHCHLTRRRFWAAGVNDICAVDQHDKWQRFGLCMHVGMDPFSSRIHWLKVWHTNRNTKLIASYYLDFVQQLGAMPLIMQSDPRTENVGLTNAHTVLHQLHDPRLQGTLQHHTMRDKKNVMPEIVWSQLRRQWSSGFETKIEEGFINDWIDFNDHLDIMIYRYLFIPWIQDELNSFHDRINFNCKRHDQHKVRPQGPPHDIYFNPGRYDALDFQVKVDPELLTQVRETYAPPTDPVFVLVPHAFAEAANAFIQVLGISAISGNNIWDVFKQVQQCFTDFNSPLSGPATWAGLLESVQLLLVEVVEEPQQFIPHVAVVCEHELEVEEDSEEDSRKGQEGIQELVVDALTDDKAEDAAADWF